ncbi:MAG: helix-turn-helix transcriptional regulator [Fusicatenibacter sp.]
MLLLLNVIRICAIRFKSRFTPSVPAIHAILISYLQYNSLFSKMIVRKAKKAPRNCSVTLLTEKTNDQTQGEHLSLMYPFYEKQNEEFYCRCVSNITFPAHLQNTAEMLFVQDGDVEVTVQNQSKKIKKNELTLIFPDMVHSYLTRDSSDSILCLFSPSLAKDCFRLLTRQQPQYPFFSSYIHGMDLGHAFENMLQYKDKSPSISKAWLNLIVTYLISEAVLIPRDTESRTDIGYQLISYISTHFQEPLTLNTVAQELHFNKYYISRIFSQKLHCHFNEYLNQLRLNHAARLLRETDCSITDIWQDAGFESQKTFNRTFLAHYQMTPSQYRKEISFLH